MITRMPKRSIFREQAVQKYRQNQEKSVLPRIVAPPIFLFFWVLLAILTAAGIVAWLGQVPLYVTGSGVVLNTDVLSNQDHNEAVAVVPLVGRDVVRIHVGLPLSIQVGSTGPQLTRTVDAISPTVISPDEIRRRYGIEVTDPAQLVSIGLGPTIPGPIYAGSSVHIQIQVGSRSLLSLFPLFSSMEKEA